MPKHNNQIHNQNEEKEKRASELSRIIQNLKRKEEHLQTEVTEHKRAVEALRLSEQKFFILFEKSAFPASLSRLPDGVITNVNEAFERAFGYTKQEAIGKTSLELGINSDEESRARILATLKEHGSVRNQELALHTKSGEMRIFSVNVDLMDIGDQKYILNTTQDITERKQAEEMLCQNEERFSSAFEYSSIGMSLVAEDGRFFKVNNALRDIVGYSDQELLAKTFQDITHPDDMDADLAHLHQLVVGEILTYKIEKRYFHKSGQVVWVLLNVSMIHDAQGKPPYFISQIQDITERKQAEEELVLANQELFFQNEEKENRAAELVLANQELAFQNDEKEKRAAELVIANKELVFQNEEKEKRAAELIIANKELAFQNDEKEKRAAELVIANKELVFQNEEKEKRAAELVIANKELAFQNDEKEKRAAELVIANKELVFQNEEKEKRAAE